MHIRANAKINLSLSIADRRDAYHLLDMIMQEIDLCDELEIQPAQSTQVTLLNGGFLPRENTLRRAVRIFGEKSGLAAGADIRIMKRIPAQAGLGGGSSDGVAVLKAMNTLYGDPLTESQLGQAALEIGADCPFFLHGGTQRVQGIGEKMKPVKGRLRLEYLLIKPEKGVPTGEAFFVADRIGWPEVDTEAAAAALMAGDRKAYMRAAGNALEPAAFTLVPELVQLRRMLVDLGAEFTLMSGSGSCLFGVFPDPARRRQAAAVLRKQSGLFVCEAYDVAQIDA